MNWFKALSIKLPIYDYSKISHFTLYRKPLSALEPRPFVILAGLSPTKNEKKKLTNNKKHFLSVFISFTVCCAPYVSTLVPHTVLNQSEQRRCHFDQSGAKKQPIVHASSREFHVLSAGYKFSRAYR